jgi:hypothetical protein
MSAAEIETALLSKLGADGAIADSGDFAAANGWDHNAVVGVIKSLWSAEMVLTEVGAVAWGDRARLQRCAECSSARTCHPAAAFRCCPQPIRLLDHRRTTPQDIAHSKYAVRADSESFAADGSPEAQVWAAVPPQGTTLAALKALLPGDVADLGFRQAMQQK